MSSDKHTQSQTNLIGTPSPLHIHLLAGHKDALEQALGSGHSRNLSDNASVRELINHFTINENEQDLANLGAKLQGGGLTRGKSEGSFHHQNLDSKLNMHLNLPISHGSHNMKMLKLLDFNLAADFLPRLEETKKMLENDLLTVHEEIVAVANTLEENLKHGESIRSRITLTDRRIVNWSSLK